MTIFFPKIPLKAMIDIKYRLTVTTLLFRYAKTSGRLDHQNAVTFHETLSAKKIARFRLKARHFYAIIRKNCDGTSMKLTYRHTIGASFIGYAVQAIVNNFIPLLFLTFREEFGIPLEQITVLITVNFIVQLAVDLSSAFFIDKIGYRASALLAHGFVIAGLALLTVLPGLMPNAFVGLLIAVIVYALGGGLLEVIISPVVEACPTKNKTQVMSFLHSAYCWGSVAVIALSTAFFAAFGTHNWRILALIWTAVPLFNLFLFCKVPIAPLVAEDVQGLSVKDLFKNKMLWLFMLFMLCAGASEQTVSQWASTFAEQGLGVSKTVGDLAGPALFAVLMGASRTLYGKLGHKIKLDAAIAVCGGLCVGAYLLIALTALPVFGLIGMAVSGFAVGILWPGAFSMASGTIRNGGTAMFAFLALAGDLGCSAGPTFAGIIAGQADDNLRLGILAAIVFPALSVVTILLIMAAKKRSANKEIRETRE